MVESLFEASRRVFATSIGYVETRSALSAMTSAGRLRGSSATRARLDLERIWRDLNVVRLDDRLVELAGEAAEHSRLRAGDAIQLTSAVTLTDPELVFAVWDHELARAAREAGLAVAP